MNKLITKGLTILLLTTLVACTDQNKADLVIYAAQIAELTEPLIARFEAETGLKTQIIVAGTGELIKRIEMEQNAPIADVLFGGSPSMVAGISGQLATYVSPNNSAIIEAYQNRAGNLTLATISPTVFIINHEKLGDIALSSYAHLLNPALKGKIAFADPQKSSTSFNHIINMLYALSDAEDTNFTKGWQYINSFVQNIDGKLLGSSSLVFKSVIDGEFAVGLSYEPVVLRFSDGNPNISVVYADEGVIAPAEGVYVVKNAPHSENAQKFVDFMTSLSVQEMLENQLYTRGVRSDLVNTALTPIGTLNIITTNDDNVNSQSESYLMHFKDIFASLN